MARGLGDRQKQILKLLRDNIQAEQMVDIREAYTLLKQHFYSGVLNGSYDPVLNRARVSISQSVRGLEIRGYLRKKKVLSKFRKQNSVEFAMNEIFGESTEPVAQYITYISVTKEGRELVID